jgi:hypothetical protein
LLLCFFTFLRHPNLTSSSSRSTTTRTTTTKTTTGFFSCVF